MRRTLALLLALTFSACDCTGGRPPVLERDGGRGGGQADSGSTDGGNEDSGTPSDAGATDGGLIDGGDPDASVPPERYCDAIVGAWCDHLLGCGAMDLAQRADCPSIFAWTCAADQIVFGVDSGQVSYDGRAAARCVADIALASCAETTPVPSTCDVIFTAATSPGGSCSRQWNGTCAGGYCNGSDCAATCATYKPLDAGCSGNFGDECGLDAVCRSGFCERLRDAGESCSPNDPCKAGLCNPNSGVCVEFGTAPLDAGCVSPAECAPGLACIDSFCQPPRQITEACRIFGGAQCDAPFTCRSFDGGFTGICWPRSDAGEGCQGVPEDCFDGLVCSSPSLFAAGTCLRFEPEDAGCNRAVQNCRFGLRCAENRTCTRIPKTGESCTNDPLNFRGPDCLAGYCDGGVCAGAKDAGESCTRPWDCASTYCTNGECAALCL